MVVMDRLNGGCVILHGRRCLPGEGVRELSDEGLWTSTDGLLDLNVRLGDPAPGGAQLENGLTR